MYSITINGVTYPLLDLSIKRQLKDLNKATGTIAITGTVPTMDVDATIKYVPTNTVVMEGILKSLKETQKYQYNFEVMEKAYELYDSYVKVNNSYVVTVPANTTVNAIIDNYILYGAPNGWARDSASSDSSAMPSLRFNYTSRLAALIAVLKERRGHMLWFDSVNRKVSFGPYRPGNTYTISSYIQLKTESDSIKRKVTKIIVLGKTDDIMGVAGSGEKMLVYRYVDATTQADAQLVANTLLAQVGVTRTRLTLELTPTYTYMEGDRVVINGQTLLVTDVEIKLDKTVLGLISGELTLLDLLGDRISLVQGGTFTGAQVNWEGGSQNIGASAPGKFVIYIMNKDKVGSYYINVKLNKYVKQATTLSVPSGDSTGLAITGATAASHTTGISLQSALTGLSNIPTTPSASANSVGVFYCDNYSDGFRPGDGYYLQFSTDTNVTWDPDTGRSYFYTYATSGHTCDYQLLVLHMTAVLAPKNTFNMFWYVTEYSWAQGIWITVTAPQRAYFSKMMEANVISGSVYFTGLTYNYPYTERRFRIMFRPDGTNAELFMDRIWVHLTGLWNHTHSVSVATHTHLVSDPSHSTPWTDPSHVHSLNEGSGHSTPITTPAQSHEGSGVDNPSLVNSYPSNLVVKVKNYLYPNGVTVLTNAGGYETSFGGYINDYLVTGTNEIIVESATAGNVYLSGNYISYG